MFDSKALGQTVRRYRKKKGLSQQALAGQLYVTAQSVSKWERGEALPDLARLCALAELFHITVDTLLGEQAHQRRYMVAIDGGGTKTDFVLLDMQGRVCASGTQGASNPNVCTVEETCRVLQKGIAALYVRPEELVGIFAGISGCGVEKNRTAVTGFLQAQYPNARIRCDTDVLNVWGCVPAAEDGVLAICGTGSVVYAQERGSLHRLGGWGYLLDSEGSGFGIGRDALCAALAWEEGIGPKTEVAVLVKEQLGGPVWDSIGDIYSQGQKYVASFAPCVFEAAHRGDRAAKAVLRRHFARLGFLLREALERYSCGSTVILAGGLLREKETVVELLREELPPGTHIQIPEQPQIFGACIQCCRLCGVDTALFIKNYSRAGDGPYA